MKWNSTLYDNAHNFVAKYGEGILSFLQPKADEIILDLGCGTGDLTKKISETGASVIGVDSSPEMITKAKIKFPELEFKVVDARRIQYQDHFHAIFSNAVLHWVSPPEEAVASMYHALKPGGRIVVEFGGKGNNEHMLAALRKVLIAKNYHDNAKINFWFYPSIGEYSTLLEKTGFRVIRAEHFDRQTPLTGENGMKDWFKMFAGNFFEGIPDQEKEFILDEVQENLRATHFIDSVWYADYKRIRAVALKV